MMFECPNGGTVSEGSKVKYFVMITVCLMCFSGCLPLLGAVARSSQRRQHQRHERQARIHSVQSQFDRWEAQTARREARQERQRAQNCRWGVGINC